MIIDPVLQKLPPQSIEAEESVLSACMLGAAPDAVEMLSYDDFYRTAHQKIFQSLEQLVDAKTNVDIATIVNHLRDKSELEEVGGAAYIARLVDTVPASTALKDHAKIIKQAAKKRQIIAICNETVEKCYNGREVPEILGDLDSATANIDVQTGEFVKLGDLLDPAIEYWDSLRTSPGSSGIPCGLADVDKKFGGFQGSCLYVIGARPSMGKSALGMRICRGAAKNGFPALFRSIEMSRREVVSREVSCESRVDGERFRSGDINNVHWRKIADAADIIHQLPIWIADGSTANIKEIQSQMRAFHKEHGRFIGVVDYLQYIKGIKSERLDVEIGTITRGLKTSAKDLDIPIVLLAQLSRAVEQRNDKRPVISDLRGSGEIEQDADIIAFLYRDEVYNDDEDNPRKGVAELIVRKFRGGKLGTVFLTWIDHRTTFENIAR